MTSLASSAISFEDTEPNALPPSPILIATSILPASIFLPSSCASSYCCCDYLWNNDIPAQNKLDFSADPQTFFRSMLSLKDGKTRNGKHLYYYSYMEKNKDYKARTSIDADDTYGMEFTLFNVVNDSNQPLGYYYARILYVLPNSPASSAGLERGDWIVGVKGKNNINSDNYVCGQDLNEGKCNCS